MKKLHPAWILYILAVTSFVVATFFWQDQFVIIGVGFLIAALLVAVKNSGDYY